ncbi:MAG: DUF4405 domain-containing protein [Chlamydiae bacterium]|nr:DUF4405 domain-containing protein [Chlamydiota bacterium]MBI3267273.1 DUF4405 domain-containing protein [Chlamydiota bacterium]
MKIPKKQRSILYISLIILFLSGAIWWGANFLIKPETEIDSFIYTSRSLSLEIHGGVAMVVLMVLGSLIPNHILKSWRAKLNRRSGVLLITVFVLLILTGYFLYYADENLRNFSSTLHLVLGFLLPFFVIGHILRSRAFRRKENKRRVGRVKIQERAVL